VVLRLLKSLWRLVRDGEMLVSANAATPFKKLPDRCLERAPSDEVTKAEEVFQSVL